MKTIKALVCGGILLASALVSTALFADSVATKERTVTKLADGIYEIRHPDAPDTFPQSNTTVVIGKRGVLVVDSCLLPSAAREDIAQIRKWTNVPVTYLVNTHWHFDHTIGNATYAEAFPGVQIVAHRATQRTIADFNPGAIARYPTRGERFRKILDSGKNPDGTPLSEADRKDYEKSIAGLAAVVSEMKNAKQLPPNVAFDRELTIDLGDRVVQLKHLGLGNTAGDTVIYLPAEKILMTGDLLVHPVPYMFGGFPVDFPRTLREMAKLDATTIVPGHGDIQRDKAYILQTIDFMEAMNAEIEREINDGKSLDEVRQLLPTRVDMKAWRERFAGASADDQGFFDQAFAAMVTAAFNQIRAR